MNDEIRIYVADLAAYNNGKLHGVWINACDDLDDIQDRINKMLSKSPEGFAEEYAIHDYEGFGSLFISAYEGIDEVHKMACFIQEHDDLGAKLLDHYCGDIDEAERALSDNYCGCYKSLADYAEELTEQTSEIPQNLRYYIDYERMGRDMELGGDVFTVETAFEEVHIFWNS